MTQAQVLAVLTTLGLGTVAAAIIAGLFNRRKVSGDYLTAVSTSLVAPLQNEVARLRGILAEQETRHFRELGLLRDELEETRADLAQNRQLCEDEAARLREELEDARSQVRALLSSVRQVRERGTLGP